jgi:hypothetical protein
MTAAPKATLFAADTVCQVESEVWGIKARYLITSVKMHGGDRELADLRVVPLGTELRA